MARRRTAGRVVVVRRYGWKQTPGDQHASGLVGGGAPHAGGGASGARMAGASRLRGPGDPLGRLQCGSAVTDLPLPCLQAQRRSALAAAGPMAGNVLHARAVPEHRPCVRERAHRGVGSARSRQPQSHHKCSLSVRPPMRTHLPSGCLSGCRHAAAGADRPRNGSETSALRSAPPWRRRDHRPLGQIP